MHARRMTSFLDGSISFRYNYIVTNICLQRGYDIMKCIRLLICMVLLCTLPLSCLAAPAIQHDYQAMDSERIVYSLPEGLSAKVSKADGQLNVHIDCAKTDWDKLVSVINSNNEIHISMSSQAPNASFTTCHQGNTTIYIDPENGTLTQQSFADFDEMIRHEFEGTEPSEIARSGQKNSWEIASFDAQSSSVLPIFTDQNTQIAYLIVWNPDGNNPIYEYYFINISFTDDAARKVTMPVIPSNRILAYKDDQMTSTVTPGSVVYEIPLGHQLCGKKVSTRIIPPAGAHSWRIAGDDKIHPLGVFESNGNAILMLSEETYVWPNTFAESKAMPILWYADEQGQNLLRAERLSIDVITGDPHPFPYYIDELKPVSQDRLIYRIEYDRKALASLSGISATYNTDNADTGVFRLAVDPDIIPEDVDLDAMDIALFVEPPEGAIAYTAEHRTRNTIHGQMQDYYDRNYLRHLTNPEERKWEYPATFNSKQYIYFGGMNVANSRSFEHDRSLCLYTEGENSHRFTGGVTIIYWYDSLEKTAQPIKKEYFVQKMNPFTIETRQPAYTDESQIPEKITLPVIILSKGEEITDLFLVIEKTPTSDPNHIYYDLYVVDADGNERKLGGDAIVIIPYPDERLGENAPYSFKLAHYHNGKKLEYTEENGLLWRTEHGLAFKTQEFSPFILSWDPMNLDPAGDPAGAENLPQTGDSSMPLVILLAMLVVAVTGLYSLSKRRA